MGIEEERDAHQSFKLAATIACGSTQNQLNEFICPVCGNGKALAIRWIDSLAAWCDKCKERLPEDRN